MQKTIVDIFYNIFNSHCSTFYSISQSSHACRVCDIDIRINFVSYVSSTCFIQWFTVIKCIHFSLINSSSYLIIRCKQLWIRSLLIGVKVAFINIGVVLFLDDLYFTYLLQITIIIILLINQPSEKSQRCSIEVGVCASSRSKGTFSSNIKPNIFNYLRIEY